MGECVVFVTRRRMRGVREDAGGELTRDRKSTGQITLFAAGDTLLILAGPALGCWDELRSLAYHPKDGTFDYLSAPPDDVRTFAGGVWTGDEAVFWYGEGPTVLDLEKDQWRTLGLPLHEATSGAQSIVRTGEAIIAWGGSRLEDDGSSVARSGFLFRPSSARPSPAPMPASCPRGGP